MPKSVATVAEFYREDRYEPTVNLGYERRKLGSL